MTLRDFFGFITLEIMPWCRKFMGYTQIQLIWEQKYYHHWEATASVSSARKSSIDANSNEKRAGTGGERRGVCARCSLVGISSSRCSQQMSKQVRYFEASRQCTCSQDQRATLNIFSVLLNLVVLFSVFGASVPSEFADFPQSAHFFVLLSDLRRVFMSCRAVATLYHRTLCVYFTDLLNYITS